jgi:hypothetical protein
MEFTNNIKEEKTTEMKPEKRSWRLLPQKAGRMLLQTA